MKTEIIATSQIPKDNNWSKPAVYMLKNSNVEMLVLSNGEEEDDVFNGTVIHIKKLSPDYALSRFVGEYCKELSKGLFTKIDGWVGVKYNL